ncbi:STAS domain-containing protein [Streptomyces sp. NPDC048111]|uniref:STAS domain-containing protein n=1 Tax=Streptomyces sp. NPDC048111 TaxID=3365500 RepID=UPI003718BD22
MPEQRSLGCRPLTERSRAVQPPAGPDRLEWPELRIASHSSGDRVTVTVRGELDVDTAPQLYNAVGAALARSRCGVDLDLGRVPFCDCSGLGALLRARHGALVQGKTLTLSAAAPCVAQLLALTHTRTLFSAA